MLLGSTGIKHFSNRTRDLIYHIFHFNYAASYFQAYPQLQLQLWLQLKEYYFKFLLRVVEWVFLCGVAFVWYDSLFITASSSST